MISQDQKRKSQNWRKKCHATCRKLKERNFHYGCSFTIHGSTKGMLDNFIEDANYDTCKWLICEFGFDAKKDNITIDYNGSKEYKNPIDCVEATWDSQEEGNVYSSTRTIQKLDHK
eukprot:UN28661